MEPVTMTRAQYQATYGAPPNVPVPVAQPVTPDPTPVTMTKAQYQATYGQPPQVNTPIVGQIASNLGDTFKQGAKNVMADINNPANDVPGVEGSLSRVATLGHLAGDVAGTAGGILGSVISPFLPQVVKDKLGDATKYVQDKVNAIPGMTPEIAKGLGDLFNTATLLGGAKAEPVVSETASTGLQTIKSAITKTPEEIAAQSAADLKSNLQGVADDWASPVKEVGNRFNNAKAVLEKDPNVTNTLAQNGINPFENVEDGKYNTEGTAQKLRDDNGKLSKDLLRPSLEVADKSVKPTLVKELKPSVDNTFGVTADDAEAIQSKLTKKIAALDRKYPEGMNLMDLLDEKITYDKNGGYKAYKSNADNIDAIANRAVADSLRDTLGAKGEAAGIPVNDFQAELTKNYRAADYLDALHGKKAPVTIGQSIARYSAKIGGAKVAGLLGGGDLVSEFVGYHIGGALEKFVENMTNPMRDSFLKNLKTTNPPAFTKIQDYLIKNAPK